MKVNSILFFVAFLFVPFLVKAQENKNELGVSLFSLQAYGPGDYLYDLGLGGYINSINSVIYKRKINEALKLRGIATAEINASSFPDYRDECYDCGTFTHTAVASGVSLGAETGRSFGKFGGYGYTDLFYQFKYETRDYVSGWGFSSYNYQQEIQSLGLRIGFGLEYHFTEKLSLAVEPSLALSKLQTTGKGYDNNTRVEWNKDKSNELKFRGINIFSLNVSF